MILQSVSSVPEEILDKVFKELNSLSRSGRKALFACLTVSHQIHRIVLPHFFHTVTYKDKHGGWHAFPPLVTYLKLHPHHARLINTLSLQGASIQTYGSFLSLQQLNALLRVLPALQNLGIFDILITNRHTLNGPSPYNGISQHHTKPIRHLVLHNLTFEQIWRDSTQSAQVTHLQSLLSPCTISLIDICHPVLAHGHALQLWNGTLSALYIRQADGDILNQHNSMQRMVTVTGLRDFQMWSVGSSSVIIFKLILAQNADTLQSLMFGVSGMYRFEGA